MINFDLIVHTIFINNIKVIFLTFHYEMLFVTFNDRTCHS